jgi:hypothetical protein
VLVPRLSDTVMALMFEAIFAEAGKLGHFALVSVCGDDPDDEKTATELLLARRVDGLVLATSRLDDQLPRHLREQEIPHVLVLRTDGVSPSSLGDDELGGYLATRHLIDIGHTDIGLLAGPEFTSSSRDRQAGYRRAMTEAGLTVSGNRIRHSEYSVEAGENAGTDLLTAAPELTAVFAVNDKPGHRRHGIGPTARQADRQRPCPRRLQRHPNRQPATRATDLRPHAVHADRHHRARTPPFPGGHRGPDPPGDADPDTPGLHPPTPLADTRGSVVVKL